MTYLVNTLDVIYVALLRGVNHLARPLSKIVAGPSYTPSFPILLLLRLLILNIASLIIIS